MFENVILATDLSPAWDEIVACAGELTALGCSRAILIHVITLKFLMGMEGMAEAEAWPRLERQAAQLETQGLAVDMEMPTGLPAFSLNEVARCRGADLIVVGSHGQSLWREEVLGCVTCAVLHHASYPVLLLNVKVKEGMKQGTCRLQATELLRHLLFPTDFSEIADRAHRYVEFLASKGANRVTVLNALDVPGHEVYPPGYQDWAESAARQLLEDRGQRLEQAGVHQLETRLDAGHPIPAILEVLKTQDISLIVMGTQGKGFIKEIFLGSVAHNISRLAPCPVLLIPATARSGGSS